MPIFRVAGIKLRLGRPDVCKRFGLRICPIIVYVPFWWVLISCLENSRRVPMLVSMHVEAMPEKLAACAFALFSKRGIERVRMDDIASEAGVTKGSLYWHYNTKCEVIHAACQHYYKDWRKQMERETAKASTPAGKLTRAIRSSVSTCLIDDGNRTFTLELFTLSIHDEEVRRGWRLFFDGVKSFYISLLKQAVEAGEVTSPSPAAAVDLMLAAMEGYKLRALFEPQLCARSAEKRIASELLAMVGIHR